MTPLVSVYCLAYNHEKYIRETLEGFMRQKTDFSYEVIVHDDASTDGTANIIREYAEKYPEIIKPIIQTENQYSKGLLIFHSFIYPHIRGKYLAVCEGDDYWCDEYKLQKQVDWMEAHPDYSLCAHNSKIINCADGKTELFNDIEHDRDFSFEEILRGGKEGRTVFHTSSILFRYEFAITPIDFRVKGIGDYPKFLYMALCGRVHCFAEAMSVYRAFVPGSWTSCMRFSTDALKRREEHWNNFKRMLHNIDEFTEGRYSKCINERIRNGDVKLLQEKGDLKTIRTQYPDLYKRFNPKQKMILYIHHYFPALFRAYRKLRYK